ncbi:MAG: hypothetical protein KBA55_11710 [Ruminococcus sp.]|nr:hypothetical protein [Ruminococcus sp.]
MNDISKLKQAKLFLEKLANGRDPISGERVSENDIVRDSRIISCLDTAVEALEREIEELCAGAGKDKNCERKGFFITASQAAQLSINEKGCQVSDIAKEINRVTADNGSKIMQAKWINDWLESIGMLFRNGDGNRFATNDGNDLGITSEVRLSSNGKESYTNLFSAQAQKFIYDNIENIASQHCTSASEQ